MASIHVRRLLPQDRLLARETFLVMAEVFGESCEPLGDEYLDRLLLSQSFWALSAIAGDQVVGGITAHVLPMTRSESMELFIYDLAVKGQYRRNGVGRRLVTDLRTAAAAGGINEVFVAADNDDRHALDFYRALGADELAATFFSWTRNDAGERPRD